MDKGEDLIVKYCSYCGVKLINISKYCPECGKKIEVELQIGDGKYKGFLTQDERVFSNDYKGFIDTYNQCFPEHLKGERREYIESLDDTSFVLKTPYIDGEISIGTSISMKSGNRDPKIYDSPQFSSPYLIPKWLELGLEQIPIAYRKEIKRILSQPYQGSVSSKRWFMEIVDMDYYGEVVKYLFIRFRLNVAYRQPLFGYEQNYFIDRIIKARIENEYNPPYVMKLKGVSFENRQENIRKLKHRWETLYLMIDSSSGGMLVKSLDGELGFIPQEESFKIKFLYDYIELIVLLEDVVGLSSYENLGVKVLIYPAVYGLDYNKISDISDFHKYIGYFRGDETVPLSWKRDIE